MFKVIKGNNGVRWAGNRCIHVAVSILLFSDLPYFDPWTEFGIREDRATKPLKNIS